MRQPAGLLRSDGTCRNQSGPEPALSPSYSEILYFVLYYIITALIATSPFKTFTHKTYEEFIKYIFCYKINDPVYTK